MRVINYIGSPVLFVGLNVLIMILSYLRIKTDYDMGDLANQENQYEYLWAFSINIMKLIMVNSLFEIVKKYLLMSLNIRSSQIVHKQLITNVLAAPVNLFFDTTQSGTIINRFTGDIHKFDGEVMHKIEWGAGITFRVLAVFSSVYFINTKFLLFIPFLVVYSCYIYKFGLAGFQQLIRVIRVSESPLNNHLSETVSGNTTIRAFKKEELFI